jgi:hypothetical protein
MKDTPEVNSTDAHFLSALRDSLEVFSSADLLAVAGGLQLLPDNAERSLRLEAFAHTCAALPLSNSLPKISIPRLRQLLNQHVSLSSIAHGEDPYPGAFVEEVSFYGGSYPVFPGLTSGVTYVFKRLCQCLFGRPHPYSSAAREAYALIRGTLMISREIATRAGLERTVEPVSAPGGPIIVPNSARAAQLKHAVTFSKMDIESTFGVQRDGFTSWGRITVQAGSILLEAHHGDDGPLLLTPIVQCGESFIVSCPESLLSALNHHIVSIAIEHGAQDWLADTYNLAVVQSVEKCFEYLDCAQLEWTPANDEVVPGTRECVFWCDVDKFVFVIVATDRLDDFNQETPYGTAASPPDLADLLEKRFLEAESSIYLRTPNINGLLCMFIHQGVGRAHFLGFGQVGVASLFQALSGSEFETFATLESGDPLSLWRFARDSSEIREKMFIQSWSALDEFGLYRSHHYSYYLNDGGPVNVVSVATDFSGTLIREAIAKRDWHGVPKYDGRTIVDVTTLHGTRTIPIYIPDPLTEERAAAFAEKIAFPLWIIAPEDSRQTQCHRVYAELANALTYWLWQCADDLRGFITPGYMIAGPLTILLVLDAPNEWTDHQQSSSTMMADTPFDCDIKESIPQITIGFRSGSGRLFRTPDNDGERHLLRTALNALCKLFHSEDRVSDHQIEQIIERREPLGQKKMLLFLDGSHAPTLDPRGIPRFHPIPQGDLEEVLDRVGNHLINSEHLVYGPIAREKRNDTLTSIVGYCFSQLERYVQTLDPNGLLEYLVERNEATVYSEARQRLMMPTRLLCFSDISDVAKEIKDDMGQIAQSGLAGRFLIEYVAAQPPIGLRKMSLIAYNELRALAEQIITFGMSSDAVHYDLTDLQLSILRSGRLGRIEPQYRAAHEGHTTQLTGERIARAAARFGDYWRDPSDVSGDKPELVNALDEASTDEFGFSMVDLGIFLRGVRFLGMDQSYGVASMKADSLSTSLATSLGWTREKIERAIDLFSLKWRDKFMDAGENISKANLYPWRYNRDLSYLRRPLIQRPSQGGSELLWGNRHVEVAMDNLLSLCLTGRLKAKRLPMRRFIGSLRHDQGERFNDRVADVLSGDPSLRVERRVKKVAVLRFDNLGDIDVLVGEPVERRIYVIECKDFSAARTPYELANEIEEMVQEKIGKKSILQKHQARVDWIKQHSAEAVHFLRMPENRKWPIYSIIVVDEPMLTSRLRQLDAIVLTIEQLRESGLRRAARV